MRKFLLIYSASVTLLLVGGAAWINHSTNENKRLRRNQEALTSEIEYYKSERGEAVATIQALELHLAEFKRMRQRDTERIKELNIALRRVESVATTSTATQLTIEAPLRDTTVARTDLCSTLATRIGFEPILDSGKSFEWSDNWVTVKGVILNKRVECSVESVDTLRQILHRVPRKFLCFRFGTKAIRQEIVSTNPHTKVVYAEYIELSRQRKRRNRQTPAYTDFVLMEE